MRSRSLAPVRLLCLGLAVALLPAPALAMGYELTPIAFDGDTAPETGGGTFTFFYTPSALTDSGDVAFGASTTGGTAFSATFVYSAGAIDARMIFGTPAPDVGGTFGGDGVFPKLNRHGMVSNMKTLSGATVPGGIFTSDGAIDAARVYDGQTAPDTGGGTYATTFGELSLHSFDDAGNVSFISSVSGGTVSSGIFLSDGVSDVSIALAGESAPDTGGTYDTFGWIARNPLGTTYFAATVAGGSAAEGLFRASGGTDSSIALAGDIAPDTGGQTYAMFAFPVTSISGNVAFIAALAGGGAPAGIFIDVDGSNRLIALEGAVMPGTGGGFVGPTDSAGPIVMDRAGRVYFPATLTGGSVASAVFEYDPASDVLRPILTDGQEVPGTGGETISEFGPISVNAPGQIAMQVTLFDDRIGMVLASPTTVPALPGAGLLAAGMLIAAAAAVSLRRLAA